MKLNTGQKFWVRAKKVIPGGTMLFSKNPDLQLPTKWPAYFSKTKGCNVWDLDGNKFNDVFLMGIGTNSLGYSHSVIDKHVKKVVDAGNMSSLNSIDEILLAEKLIELNPWAGSVRFTRSGGEANAVAVRIARAYSGRDDIAICGYHGWHDWYLSANLKKKSNLNNFLIKDLNISGVPKKLKNTAHPFEYNNFEQLKKIVMKNKIGVIKMEVERDHKPKNEFLKKVRNLATKNKIVLIFDECTSGFRETYGGLYLKYNITPDICIFGKALGNGYGINAIVGKQEIMEALKSTFISSTFWTERIGSVAALQTLKEMKKIHSWKIITKIGKKIKKNWSDIANLNSLKIDILGIDALPKFLFKGDNHLAYKTYLSQEMLKRKILASNAIYASIAHDDQILEKYFDYLNKIFKKIAQCENERENIFDLLETKVSLNGIRSKKTF
jgi:glutamate-1-semialdehyde 2,1-aminomutase